MSTIRALVLHGDISPESAADWAAGKSITKSEESKLKQHASLKSEVAPELVNKIRIDIVPLLESGRERSPVKSVPRNNVSKQKKKKKYGGDWSEKNSKARRNNLFSKNASLLPEDHSRTTQDSNSSRSCDESVLAGSSKGHSRSFSSRSHNDSLTYDKRQHVDRAKSHYPVAHSTPQSKTSRGMRSGCISMGDLISHSQSERVRNPVRQSEANDGERSKHGKKNRRKSGGNSKQQYFPPNNNTPDEFPKLGATESNDGPTETVQPALLPSADLNDRGNSSERAVPSAWGQAAATSADLNDQGKAPKRVTLAWGSATATSSNSTDRGNASERAAPTAWGQATATSDLKGQGNAPKRVSLAWGSAAATPSNLTDRGNASERAVPPACGQTAATSADLTDQGKAPKRVPLAWGQAAATSAASKAGLSGAWAKKRGSVDSTSQSPLQDKLGVNAEELWEADPAHVHVKFDVDDFERTQSAYCTDYCYINGWGTPKLNSAGDSVSSSKSQDAFDSRKDSVSVDSWKDAVAWQSHDSKTEFEKANCGEEVTTQKMENSCTSVRVRTSTCSEELDLSSKLPASDHECDISSITEQGDFYSALTSSLCEGDDSRISHSTNTSPIKRVSITSVLMPTSFTTPSKSAAMEQNVLAPNPLDVTDKPILDLYARMYLACLKNSLMPSISVEMHFLTQLLTAQQGEDYQPPNQSQDDIEDRNYFTSVHNVVYFAVEVLSRVPQLLKGLEPKTLKLLMQNDRVEIFKAEFHEDITRMYEEMYGDDDSCASVSSCQERVEMFPYIKPEPIFRKHYGNDEDFNAANLIRDEFDAVLRWWVQNHDKHDKPGYVFEQAHGKRIRTVFDKSGTVTFFHFGKYFVKTLLEDCMMDYYIRLKKDCDNAEGADVFKDGNEQERMVKLAERMLAPLPGSGGVGGPSATTKFTGRQEFFAEFIRIANNMYLNEWVLATLRLLINQLNEQEFTKEGNDKANPESDQDFANAVISLRILGKFVSYIVHMPFNHKFTGNLPDCIMQEMLELRNLSPSFVSLTRTVQDACRKGRLAVTIPWVVEFLAMVDPLGPLSVHYSPVMDDLCRLLRVMNVGLWENANFSNLMVVTSLGWLFEQPHMPMGFYYKQPPSPQDWEDELIRSSVLTNPALDSLVTSDLFMICCPYFSASHLALSDYQNGNRKRIEVRKVAPRHPGKKPKQKPDDSDSANDDGGDKTLFQYALKDKVKPEECGIVDSVVDMAFVNVSKRMKEVTLPAALAQCNEEDLSKVACTARAAHEDACKSIHEDAMSVGVKILETSLPVLLSGDMVPYIKEILMEKSKSELKEKFSKWITENVIYDSFHKEVATKAEKHAKLKAMGGKKVKRKKPNSRLFKKSLNSQNGNAGAGPQAYDSLDEDEDDEVDGGEDFESGHFAGLGSSRKKLQWKVKIADVDGVSSPHSTTADINHASSSLESTAAAPSVPLTQASCLEAASSQSDMVVSHSESSSSLVPSFTNHHKTQCSELDILDKISELEHKLETGVSISDAGDSLCTEAGPVVAGLEEDGSVVRPCITELPVQYTGLPADVAVRLMSEVQGLRIALSTRARDQGKKETPDVDLMALVKKNSAGLVHEIRSAHLDRTMNSGDWEEDKIGELLWKIEQIEKGDISDETLSGQGAEVAENWKPKSERAAESKQKTRVVSIDQCADNEPQTLWALTHGLMDVIKVFLNDNDLLAEQDTFLARFVKNVALLQCTLVFYHPSLWTEDLKLKFRDFWLSLPDVEKQGYIHLNYSFFSLDLFDVPDVEPSWPLYVDMLEDYVHHGVFTPGSFVTGLKKVVEHGMASELLPKMKDLISEYEKRPKTHNTTERTEQPATSREKPSPNNKGG